MKYSVISLTVMAALLSGCATATTDEFGIPKEPNPFGQFIGRTLVENALNLLDEDERRCGLSCQQDKRKIERANAISQRIEDEKRAEALQQSFNQRHSSIDTAETIEQVRSNNDWITEGEQQGHSLIKINNPKEFD